MDVDWEPGGITNCPLVLYPNCTVLYTVIEQQLRQLKLGASLVRRSSEQS
jgi:hypothetical protein